MIDSKYLEALVKAFRDLHGCEAKYVQTVLVIERWKGQPVWEGDGEEFALTGHPTAHRGFAWAYDDVRGSKITAILELPPVISAATAVRASIVAGGK